MLGFWLVREYAVPESKTDSDYTEALPKMEPEAVDRVVLAGPNGTAALTKTNGQWMIEDYRADGAKAGELVKALLKPTKVELVAETSARHEQLGVASGSGTLATLKAGETTAGWWLGNSADSGNYVRLEGNDKVFALSGMPGLASSTNRDDWLDKTIAAIPETEIQKLTVKNASGASLTLVRRGSDWFEEGKETALDPTPIMPLTTNLAALVTQGLVESETELPKNPTLVVTVTTDKAEETLSFYPLPDELAAVRAGSRPGVFKLAQSTMDAFDLGSADMKPKPAESPTPAAE